MGKILKLQPFFIKNKLHRFLSAFENSCYRFVHYNQFSKWVSEHKKSILYDDFYNKEAHYSKRLRLHDFIVEHFQLENKQINYFEFGVFKGESIKYWMGKSLSPESKFIGFDLFTGLPENWDDKAKGHFTTDGQFPQTDDKRCAFVAGMFQKTIVPFFRNNETNDVQTVFHFDADLYSSTVYLLFNLYHIMKQGDFLIFDEFSDILHEFRAYKQFVEATGIELELIGAINNYKHVVFQVKSI